MAGKILDMHAHLESGIQELILRRSQGTAAFFSCGNLQEWEQTAKTVREFCKVEGQDFFLSFGIHPWHCSGYVSQCTGILEKKMGALWEAYESCDVIGEIGMDSIWCEVPLDVQRQVFCVQLQIAEALGKPVVLHTKGQEKEIAELIRDFTGKICVHWYSGDIETLEQYIQKGCYFTLGPDLGCVLHGQAGSEKKALAELYQYMQKHIPAERLFLETDGISAVAWARGVEKVPLKEIPGVLKENLRILAEHKERSEREMREKIWRNLEEFLLS